MKKRYIVPVIGALASVGVSYFLKNKNTSPDNGIKGTVVNAGIPDQVDNFDREQFENSKMVSEGSTYGVHYFNEMAEEHSSEVLKKFTE